MPAADVPAWQHNTMKPQRAACSVWRQSALARRVWAERSCAPYGVGRDCLIARRPRWASFTHTRHPCQLSQLCAALQTRLVLSLLRLLLSQVRSPCAVGLMRSRICDMAARAPRVVAKAMAVRTAGSDKRAAMGGSAGRSMLRVLRSTGGQYSGGVPAGAEPDAEDAPEIGAACACCLCIGGHID